MATAKRDPRSFSELIRGDKPVLVDFYADWCGPCKMMGPVLKSLKREMGDRLEIIKIDTERNPAAAIRYQVKGVPTLILFHKGNVVWQQAGAMQLHPLKQLISEKIATLQR